MENSLRVIRSTEEIRNRIATLAEEIRLSAPSNELTVVGILDDSFVFFADLIRALNMPLSCCFINASHHRHGGQTEIMFVTEFDPRGRNILLVDGVVATGVTLDYITRQLSDRGVKSLRTCVLVDKPGERRVDITPDYTAFTSEDSFIFGYGLGIQNQYRQLPFLAVMDEESR